MELKAILAIALCLVIVGCAAFLYVRNPKYPLLSEDMPRNVFERRLRESEVNDRLSLPCRLRPAPFGIPDTRRRSR